MNSRITCRTCKGKGTEPLSSDLQEVLNHMGRARMTTEELAGKVQLTVQGVNARLVLLMKHGLVDRERKGKAFQYFRSNKTVKKKE